MIELKYLKRNETRDQAGQMGALAEPQRQLRGYLADTTLWRRHPTVQHVGLAVVYRGWEMMACEAVTAER